MGLLKLKNVKEAPFRTFSQTPFRQFLSVSINPTFLWLFHPIPFTIFSFHLNSYESSDEKAFYEHSTLALTSKPPYCCKSKTGLISSVLSAPFYLAYLQFIKGKFQRSPSKFRKWLIFLPQSFQVRSWWTLFIAIHWTPFPISSYQGPSQWICE